MSNCKVWFSDSMGLGAIGCAFCNYLKSTHRPLNILNYDFEWRSIGVLLNGHLYFDTFRINIHVLIQHCKISRLDPTHFFQFKFINFLIINQILIPFRSQFHLNLSEIFKQKKWFQISQTKKSSTLSEHCSLNIS